MVRKILELDASHSQRLRLAEGRGLWRSLAIFFAHSGDSWFWLAGLGTVWWLGPAFWKERALALGTGILLTAVLVLLVKFTVRRRRPEGEWGKIYRTTDPHSFPSGHAARAVLLVVLTIGLGPTWFGLLLLVWAPLVTLARVAMGVHYLSDVVAGALFGFAMGLILLQIYAGFGLFL